MDQTRRPTRAQAFEASEDIGRSPGGNPTFGEIVAARFNRRDILKGTLATSVIAATASPLAIAAAGRAEASEDRFRFGEVEAGVDAHHHIADGYDAKILLRWGDPVLAEVADFDPMAQTPESQAGQFGYNNDYLGYIPMRDAENPSAHGLLVVNHEYTNEELMFPGLSPEQLEDDSFAQLTQEHVAIEMMAHGGTVMEIRRENGDWAPVRDGRFNRRITAETEIAISGPAAGDARMKTSYDPAGRSVRGMLNNCAGGVTPWGTWLSAEENFHGYFWSDTPDAEGLGGDQAKSYARYGVPGGWYGWGKFHDRFNIDKEPNEPNRFGWIVEIDPFDPESRPVKRTALGRFKHEGCENILNRDGRLVIYMGDDERFDYLYRFVTANPVDMENPSANRDLLDEGTLSVAVFEADGTMRWLPLVHGEGPLAAENGFESQADILIDTRPAADLLGATRMDRPEDVQPNPVSNKVYLMLTNNTKRTEEQVDAANPRADNAFGHIVEMIPPDGDHAADEFRWEILVKCGDPSVAEVGATFNPRTSKDGWFGSPDNCAIDSSGRLWVATDGNSPDSTGRTDGVWAMETEGELRGTSRLFFRCPAGAELCGPVFTPDDETMFVAVQHPADAGDEWPEFGRVSTFEDPSTRWPDFQDGMPPRPSVLAITKQGGGKIAM